jgi:hypothetical protein
LLCVVWPLLQVKVYGETSPVGVKIIDPLLSPQPVFVTAVEIVTAVEGVIVMDAVAVQLLALVTVTL